MLRGWWSPLWVLVAALVLPVSARAQDDEEEIEKNLRGPAQGYSGAYKDDLTNQTLKDELV